MRKKRKCSMMRQLAIFVINVSETMRNLSVQNVTEQIFINLKTILFVKIVMLFLKTMKKKVRDHCHYTGKFRGAAHNICNFNYRKPKYFPVVFYNLAGYDAHLFIMKLGGQLRCIASNEEKYLSFSKKLRVDSFINGSGENIHVNREIRYIDSLKFMQSSLENLVKNLSKDQCKNMIQHFDSENGKNGKLKLDILLKTGV